MRVGTLILLVLSANPFNNVSPEQREKNKRNYELRLQAEQQVMRQACKPGV